MTVETLPNRGRGVLCVDDDRDIAEIVEAILSDEGYSVSCLYSVDGDELARMVGQLEPDCVLLDSSSRAGYDEAWREAAALHARGRHVPVVMFTAHGLDAAEAREGTSERAKAAAFAEVLEKPSTTPGWLGRPRRSYTPGNPPLGALTQAWTAAEAALPLGWHVAGPQRNDRASKGTPAC